jgi:hypothetical protein
MVPPDDSGFLETLDPLHDGRAGEPDLVGDGLIGGAAVGSEELKDASGDGVHGMRRHIGPLWIVISMYQYHTIRQMTTMDSD